MARRRKCMFCPKSQRVAQPRGLPLCRRHGGFKPISSARRRHHRKKVQWENSQSVWKGQQRRKARYAKVRSVLSGPRV
jgi:hypothetical protein